MKKLLALTIIGLFLASTAHAGVFLNTILPSQFGAGPFMTVQSDSGDVMGGALTSGYYQINDKILLELAYLLPGDGSTEALTRLGGHYELLRDPLNRAGLSVGGGVALRGFGAAGDMEVGGYGSIGLNLKRESAIGFRIGADINFKFSRQPTPNVTLGSAAVFPLPW